MITVDVGIAVAGLLVGIVVGLTGMGGGALMTPVLVFFFKVDALTAISSDVVTSLFMKPAGAIVHLVRRTANLQLVLWLCVGSVPAGFLGAVIVDHLKVFPGFEQILLALLGAALLLAAGGLIIRAWFQMTRKRLPWGEGPAPMTSAEVVVKKLPTVALGALGGLMVGMTSVGAGSLILTLLLVLYPALKPSQLVGTDLVQAVPLVAAASLGHLLAGVVRHHDVAADRRDSGRVHRRADLVEGPRRHHSSRLGHSADGLGPEADRRGHTAGADRLGGGAGRRAAGLGRAAPPLQLDQRQPVGTG